MTAICLADGKTWSITSGAPASSIGIGSYYNRITLFICVIMSCLFMYTLMSSISAFFLFISFDYISLKRALSQDPLSKIKVLCSLRYLSLTVMSEIRVIE